MTNPTQLGPWPEGVDNFHDPSHGVFQVPGPNQPPARLRAAVDVDIDDEGWPKTRAGAVGAVLAKPRQFVGSNIQVDGALLDANQALLARTSGDVVSIEHGLSTYWSDGATSGRIYGGVSINWGCSVAPTPTLSTRTGSLLPGTYAVAAAYLDAYGVEHGADVAAQITLSAAGGITATVPRTDPIAVGVRWYLAGPHGEALYWVGDTAGFSAVITEPAPTTLVCTRIGLMPPLPATALFSWRDFTLLGQGQDIYPSVGQAVHLFEPATNVLRFPQAVLGGAGLTDGFYVVTPNQLYWVACGADVRQWRPVPLGHGMSYAAGAFRASSTTLPVLQIPGAAEVAVFASSRGLVVGLPGGQVLTPTERRVHFDAPGKRARFAVDDFRLYVVIV